MITHAVAGAAIAAVIAPRNRTAMWLSVTCAMLPDIDVVGLFAGIPYGDMLGHRGLTHSIAFAFAIFLLFRKRNGACVGLATLSHGVLDAFTNGGLGVAFFAPFSAARYFFPFTPIEVSPIGLGFFSQRGWDVLRSEFVWVWCPSLVIISLMIIVGAWPLRRQTRGGAS